MQMLDRTNPTDSMKSSIEGVITSRLFQRFTLDTFRDIQEDLGIILMDRFKGMRVENGVLIVAYVDEYMNRGEYRVDGNRFSK